VSALVGLDVGTTGVKAIAITPEGEVVASAEEAYSLSMPRPGWSEQDPEDWLRASEKALARLGVGALRVGFSGQMHGLVCLDAQDRVQCKAGFQYLGSQLFRSVEERGREVLESTRGVAVLSVLQVLLHDGGECSVLQVPLEKAGEKRREPGDACRKQPTARPEHPPRLAERRQAVGAVSQCFDAREKWTTYAREK